MSDMVATEFRLRLESSINYCSRENGCDTPDFVLAEYLADCLAAFDRAVIAREKWYGRSAGNGGAFPAHRLVNENGAEIRSSDPTPPAPAKNP